MGSEPFFSQIGEIVVPVWRKKGSDPFTKVVPLFQATVSRNSLSLISSVFGRSLDARLPRQGLSRGQAELLGQIMLASFAAPAAIQPMFRILAMLSSFWRASYTGARPHRVPDPRYANGRMKIGECQSIGKSWQHYRFQPHDLIFVSYV